MRTVRKEKAKKQAGTPRIGDRRGFPGLPAEAKPFDVVGLGENSVDTVAVVSRFPRPDTKQVLESVSAMVGGQVATATVALARLGWRARYLGAVGDDEHGSRVVRALETEGVRVDVVTRPGLATRGAIILVDRNTGRRTVLEHRDPGLPLRPEELDGLDAGALTSGRILLVDARDPALSLAAARIARAAGIPVVLDVEHPGDGIDTLLQAVDVVISAADFPGALTGKRDIVQALARLASMSGAGVVVATRGPKGSVAWVGGRVIRTPGVPVKAVDTTGAGDAFRGGLIAGWLSGEGPVDASAVLEYANCAAALNCLGFGAQAGLPTRDQVAALVTRVRRGQSK